MNEKIQEMIDFLGSFSEEIGSNISKEEIIYLSYLFSGVISSSLKNRAKMEKHFSGISNILINTQEIYN